MERIRTFKTCEDNLIAIGFPNQDIMINNKNKINDKKVKDLIN